MVLHQSRMNRIESEAVNEKERERITRNSVRGDGFEYNAQNYYKFSIKLLYYLLYIRA